MKLKSKWLFYSFSLAMFLVALLGALPSPANAQQYPS